MTADISTGNGRAGAAGMGRRWRDALHDKRFLRVLGLSLFMVLAALAINALAGAYATEKASNPVTDIILSNIPVFDVDGIFVWGPIIYWLIMLIISMPQPERFPFTLKSIAAFVVIRSVFITLTHIGPFPDHIPIDTFSFSSHFNFYIFNSGADLFFSAHTGLPFLMALIFWKNKAVRLFCIFSAVFFGIVVLLGHLHYSIDVMSAFFITYTIYHICTKIFPQDLRHFKASYAQSGPNVAAIP